MTTTAAGTKENPFVETSTSDDGLTVTHTERYSENGKDYERFFMDSRDENGVIMRREEVTYENNIPEGQAFRHVYDGKGKLEMTFQTTYQNGMVEGPAKTTYYNNDLPTKIIEFSYRDGVAQGDAVETYLNNKLKVQKIIRFSYQDNERHGDAVVEDHRGRKSPYYYQNGKFKKLKRDHSLVGELKAFNAENEKYDKHSMLQDVTFDQDEVGYVHKVQRHFMGIKKQRISVTDASMQYITSATRYKNWFEQGGTTLINKIDTSDQKVHSSFRKGGYFYGFKVHASVEQGRDSYSFKKNNILFGLNRVERSEQSVYDSDKRDIMNKREYQDSFLWGVIRTKSFDSDEYSFDKTRFNFFGLNISERQKNRLSYTTKDNEDNEYTKNIYHTSRKKFFGLVRSETFEAKELDSTVCTVKRVKCLGMTWTSSENGDYKGTRFQIGKKTMSSENTWIEDKMAPLEKLFKENFVNTTDIYGQLLHNKKDMMTAQQKQQSIVNRYQGDQMIATEEQRLKSRRLDALRGHP